MELKHRRAEVGQYIRVFDAAHCAQFPVELLQERVFGRCQKAGVAVGSNLLALVVIGHIVDKHFQCDAMRSAV